MARKSTADMATVHVLPTAANFEPPETLTDDEMVIWREVVLDKPADWFDNGNKPLLVEYCRCVSQANKIAEIVNATLAEYASSYNAEAKSDYEDFRKVQSQLQTTINQLARAMRLTQQSRYRADKVDPKGKQGKGSRPWQLVQK